MSDFLLVIPEGWTQLDWQVVSSLPDLNKGNVDNWISTSQFEYLANPLKDAGLIPVDSIVTSAKLIDDTYFMVTLG